MVSAYKRPGVYVSEFTTASSSAVGPIGISSAAFVGPTWRGPTAATLVQTWAQFVQQYGGFSPDDARFSYLPYSVFAFFNNGGRDCFISRAIGTGALKSSLVLLDKAATPQATLTVSADNEGTWGNNIYVQVVERDAATGRFDLIVRNGGTGDQFIVERWLDLSMATTDARYVVSLINDVNNGSVFISVLDMGSATASPSDIPAVLAATALTGGADGAAPDTSQTSTAINALDTVDGPFGLNLPGDSNTTNIGSAITYASGRGDSFAVIDTALGLTPAQAASYAASLSASGYGAVYYPWVKVIDPSSSSSTSVRSLPPGGAVLGQYAQTDTTRGPFKAPAGLQARLASAVGTELKMSLTDLDTLAASGVNAIRQIPGSGITIMGARTLKTTGADQYVNVRRTLIYLKTSLLAGTRWALFEPNDPTLWSGIQISLQQFLTNFWKQGGLRGKTAAEAFYVLCDATNNTPSTIQNGEVHVEVGVALQFPAEFIVIQLGQWESGSSAQELTV